MFNSMQLKQTLGKAGVLIIDDEADQASLNGYAYKNSKSEEWEDDEYTTTYSSIMKLKGGFGKPFLHTIYGNSARTIVNKYNGLTIT